MHPKLAQSLKLYFSSLLVYGLGLLLIRNIPFYQNAVTQRILLYLFLAYALLAPFTYLFRVHEFSTNKPYLLLKALINTCTSMIRKEPIKWESPEKVALLFIIVKLFFLPTMISFAYNNITSLAHKMAWYPFLLTLLFAIDTSIFCIGYAVESRALGNVVKSVEPTFLGWFVALICYPPFNSIVGNYVPWGASDYAFFWTAGWTFFFQLILVGLLIIYVWATIALGLKSSNLTNRGIVSKFPYSLIRHPAYASKVTLWWITLIPVMNWYFFGGMLFWTVIYVLRAATEEKHLSLDPDYVKYKEQVKYQFIPKVI